MSKFGTVSDETQELIEKIATEINIIDWMDIKSVSTPKSKKLIEIKRCPPLGEYVAGKRDVVCVIVYERAFDMLSKEQQEILMRDAFNGVAYDSEKDKIVIGCPQINVSCGGYLKWGDKVISAAVNAVGVIQQIIEDEKEEKERAKQMKKAKQNK